MGNPVQSGSIPLNASGTPIADFVGSDADADAGLVSAASLLLSSFPE